MVDGYIDDKGPGVQLGEVPAANGRARSPSKICYQVLLPAPQLVNTSLLTTRHGGNDGALSSATNSHFANFKTTSISERQRSTVSSPQSLSTSLSDTVGDVEDAYLRSLVHEQLIAHMQPFVRRLDSLDTQVTKMSHHLHQTDSNLSVGLQEIAHLHEDFKMSYDKLAALQTGLQTNVNLIETLHEGFKNVHEGFQKCHDHQHSLQKNFSDATAAVTHFKQQEEATNMAMQLLQLEIKDMKCDIAALQEPTDAKQTAEALWNNVHKPGTTSTDVAESLKIYASDTFQPAPNRSPKTFPTLLRHPEGPLPKILQSRRVHEEQQPASNDLTCQLDNLHAPPLVMLDDFQLKGRV